MYEGLASAIAMQAIEDYQVAAKELEVATQKNATRKINTRLRRLEDARAFFESDYCEFLTGIPGNVFLEHITEIKLPEDFITALKTEATEQTEEEED